MRGNERPALRLSSASRIAGFPIPMRGNESQDRNPAISADSTVSDPHEG